tara:strand:- start:265 stop:816 length:552 start_codon:yes stop_codon:yes gene_type:complete
MLKNDFKINYSLTTELLKCDNERVVVKATLSVDGNEYTGLAEEMRNANKINKTSAVENGETSAIGRCLSAAGYYGSEYCSANELENALAQQDEITPEQENKILKGELKEARDKADSDHPLADTIKSTMETISVDDSDDEVVTFGKHKGKKWSELDEGYVEWVAKNLDRHRERANKELEKRVPF